MPTLRQLRYLVALDDHGHFGRAAEACHVSQPALSMQIRELEAELGLVLVERARNATMLTDAGTEIAARARTVLAGVHDIEALAGRRQGVLAGPYALGIIPSVAPFLLPRLLPTLRAQHPYLDLRLRESVTATLLAELADGRLDAVIAALPLDAPDLVTEALFDDPFLIARPRATRGAAPQLSLAELAAGELLLLEEGHCLRDQALAVCGQVRPGTLSSYGATSLATLVQLVAAGLGVTLVPALAAEAMADPRVELCRPAGTQASRTIGLAWRGTSPRADDQRALARLVRGTMTAPAPAGTA
ncbi:LysR substrate-binding domain-containing protein [Zavarzinia sp. CC-PAN008]|uniref:LysR substrate-binding domain-containing protein n=1 Tax=Zavarzinia sp. CC-PAN008 TaxID=3243332 RepID=UPI003F74697A